MLLLPRVTKKKHTSSADRIPGSATSSGGERELLIADLGNLKTLKGSIRRRFLYMCRNRDGSYSVQDLTLAMFAMNTADSLMKHLEEKLAYCDVMERADRRLQLHREIRKLLSERRYDNHQGGSLADLVIAEADVRDQLIQEQELEFEILKLQNLPTDSNEEDAKAEERFRNSTIMKKDLRRHSFLPVDRIAGKIVFAESAAREDLIDGEDADFRVLIECFFMRDEEDMMTVVIPTTTSDFLHM